MNPTRSLKIELKQPKPILSELNPEMACSLHNLALMGHISLVSTLNYEPFEVLDFLLSKLQKNLLEIVPIVTMLLSLCCDVLCITLL